MSGSIPRGVWSLYFRSRRPFNNVGVIRVQFVAKSEGNGMVWGSDFSISFPSNCSILCTNGPHGPTKTSTLEFSKIGNAARRAVFPGAVNTWSTRTLSFL